jgi:hypothetical protein
MKLPPSENSIRDYLEWSYRRADALLTAWNYRKEAKELKYKGNALLSQSQARIHFMLAMNFKKELTVIKSELNNTAG